MPRIIVILLLIASGTARAEIDYFQRPVGARPAVEPTDVPPAGALALAEAEGLRLAIDAELGSSYDVELEELGASFAMALGVEKLPLSPELNLTLLGSDLGRDSRAAAGEVALKLLLWKAKSESFPLSLGVTPLVQFGSGTVASTHVVANVSIGRYYLKLSGGPRLAASEVGYGFGAAAGIELVSKLSLTVLARGKATTFGDPVASFLGGQVLYELGRFRAGLLGGFEMPGTKGPSVELTIGATY